MTNSSYADGQCTTVGIGGVGESGASSLLHYQVTGDRQVEMVVRNNKTSLCPNTGAVAVLIVNGNSANHGTFTELKSTVNVLAQPGDNIVAIVHTFPLFNGISCVRFGEIEFTLEQCESG